MSVERSDWIVAGVVIYLATLWAFYGLRSGTQTGEWSENSVRCVKLGHSWQEPHGFSPGWCK